jgi:hypothetical protein
MLNLPRLKFKMRKYAQNHEIAVPKGFHPETPMWGGPAKTLAWRVTEHLVKHKVKGAHQSTSPEVIKAVFFPPPPASAMGKRIAAEAQKAISTRLSQWKIQGWYGMGNVAWCAETWSYLKMLAGSTSPKMAYVPFILSSAAKRENGLMLVSASKALPGDGVIYDWQFDHEADHIETLLSKRGNVITTAAGNSGYPYVVKRVRTTYNVIGYVRVTR